MNSRYRKTRRKSGNIQYDKPLVERESVPRLSRRGDPTFPWLADAPEELANIVALVSHFPCKGVENVPAWEMRFSVYRRYRPEIFEKYLARTGKPLTADVIKQRYEKGLTRYEQFRYASYLPAAMRLVADWRDLEKIEDACRKDPAIKAARDRGEGLWLSLKICIEVRPPYVGKKSDG